MISFQSAIRTIDYSPQRYENNDKARTLKSSIQPSSLLPLFQVVVFDNKSISSDDAEVTNFENGDGNENGAQFLVKILRYLETPQYLRKRLFPMHKSFKFVVCKF